MRICAGAGKYVGLKQVVADLPRAAFALEAQQKPSTLYRLDRAQQTTGANLPFTLGGLLGKLFLAHHVEHRFDHGAGQRTTAKGGAEIAHAQLCGAILPQQQRTAGKARAQRLCGGDHVREHTRVRDGERQAAAAHSALHLIGDQESAVLVAGSSQRLKIPVVQGKSARQSLYGFDNHGRCLAGDQRCRRRGVFAGCECHVHGRVREAIPALPCAPGYRCGRRGASVKAMLQGDHTAASGQPASQPKGILIGLRAGIHKEDPVQSRRREFRQLAGRPGAHPQCCRIAGEEQLAGLSLQGFQQAWVAVAQGAHRVAAVHIEQPASVGAMQICALPGNDLERKLGIDLRQVRCFRAAHIATPRAGRLPVHVHAGPGAVRPAVSSSPYSRFIHCTAPPAAPFTRLSSATKTATEPPPTVIER